MRTRVLDALLRRVPVFDYTAAVAQLVGRIDGEQMAVGNTIPPIDLMIGGTALHHGYSILTTNVRHFQKIPGLHVIEF